MSGKEAKELCERVEQEGFDYCFMCYSTFKEIDDEKFHNLREKYIRARNELAKYIGVD